MQAGVHRESMDRFFTTHVFFRSQLEWQSLSVCHICVLPFACGNDLNLGHQSWKEELVSQSHLCQLSCLWTPLLSVTLLGLGGSYYLPQFSLANFATLPELHSKKWLSQDLNPGPWRPMIPGHLEWCFFPREG